TYNSFEEYLTTVINNATTFEDNDFIEVTGDGSAANPYKITIKEGDDNSMLITNDQGELEWATIESIVTANETVTTLVDNKDGTFTYYNEKDIDEDGEPLADAEGVSFDVTQSGAGDPNGNNTTGKAGDVYVDESTGDIYTH